MIRTCSWCGKTIGYKKGKGFTHGICAECADKIQKGEEIKDEQNNSNS